jgi:hypothetical protein
VNPRTGERIFIPGGKVPRFSAGSGLKKKVKGGGGGGEPAAAPAGGGESPGIG